MKLETTKERVLKAVESCPEFEKVLREIFPEAFDRSVEIKAFGGVDSTDDEWLLCRRSDFEYTNKAILLNNQFNWEIKKDSHGCTVLIPTRK